MLQRSFSKKKFSVDTTGILRQTVAETGIEVSFTQVFPHRFQSIERSSSLRSEIEPPRVVIERTHV